VMFDPVAVKPDAALASAIVWFDAFISNVDRMPNNTNMLMWHRGLQLIDHGASLYFHHAWDNALGRAKDPFTRIKDHVLLPFASELQATDAKLTALITPTAIRDIVALVPDVWLNDTASFPSPQETRQAYIDYLLKRIEPPHAFIEEAIRARSLLV
jgi:hypothetical protein